MLGFVGSWRGDDIGAGSEPRSALRALTPTPAPARPLDNARIATVDDFVAFSVPAGDLVANGRVAKFLVDLRAPASPVVHFVNGNFTTGGTVLDSAKYHWSFARAALGIPEALDEFNTVTYFSPTKRYAAGVVHSYFLDGSTEPIYGLQFYPQDVVREDAIVAILVAVKAELTIPGATVAFVRTGSQQTTDNVTGALKAAGLGMFTLDQLIGSIRYLPLNAGEAWGFLRIFPKPSARLAPTDIPVFDELPLDLSVVAGVMTRDVQDSNSHVNLKSKERGTPNMVLRDAGPTNTRLAPFADAPVHFVVRADDFVLEPTTAEEVAKRLAERLDKPLIRLAAESETRVLSYDEMAATSAADALACAKRFGTKAANIAFLAHKAVLGRVGDRGSTSAKAGYDLVPAGCAVPFSFYGNLVAHRRNGKLRAALAALIDEQQKGALAGEELAGRAEDLQQLFLDAVVPPADLAAIEEAVARALPGVDKIKVRSSANAEDIPNFDGAGLHDSFSAKVDKTTKKPGCMFAADDDSDDDDDPDEPATEGNAVKRKVKPKTIACAVKGVYASLWNLRAIEERAFARIDQSTAAMGLAIVGAYDSESEVAANSVVITRVLNTDGVYGYSVSTQLGNNLVTNPDPGTYSETTVAALGVGSEPTSLTTTRYAKPTKDAPVRTTPVLTREQNLDIVQLTARVETAYCAADRTYYDGDCQFVTVDNEKPTSLDLELKILANGRYVCKQVREFGGR